MPKRHNPSHTLLGIPGAKKGEKGEENSEENGDEKEVSVDEEQGGSTMFGMGNRRSSGPLGGRRPSGKGVRQTLMGLGSVRLLNEPSENADRPFEAEDDEKKKVAKPKVGSRSGGKRDVRSTMTGLPGVEVGDKKKSGRPKLPGRGGKKGGAAARSTMMGMPAITDDSSKKPKLSTDKLSLKSPSKAAPSKSKENSEPTVSISDDHIQKARKLAKKFDQPKSEEANADAGGEEEEFDPLAGFAGVTEPKVSSLMDEEVEDLSAQVFGDGFAFGDEELDFEEDEDDDFDFEFASAPAQPSGQAGTGDIPEEDVHHDIEAAEAALADMMTDLEDVMPDENEAAESLGFDEEKAAAALAKEETAAEQDPDGPTIADANVKEMMAEVRAEKAPAPEKSAPPAPAAAKKKPKPARKAKPKPAKPAPAKAPAAPTAGAGFGLGGILALLGGLASVSWLFIPVEGANVVSAIGSLDVASQVLVVFSVVAAILAIVTALMKLPGGSKGLVLGVLGIGLGALSFSAPVLTEPLNFPVYAAAGLFVLAGVFYAFTGKKT